MLSVLGNRTYRHLFLAQVVALVGTGLATVALGLLSVEIAGANGGAVLGTAMAIKMIAYIAVAPVVGAYASRLPRRSFLVSMDAIRAIVVLALPFVDQVWQIYVLIFVLQSASAGFTPTFQATILDILPDEKDYTKALSLSRLAYDMESLSSPILAAALLTMISFRWLFAGMAIGFVCSAVLVVSVVLPRPKIGAPAGSVVEKITFGARIYLKTPRLRGLLAITLTAAAAGAMVIVNTPVMIRKVLGLKQSQVAVTLAALGGGSMIAALVLPRLLDRVPDRAIMASAGSGPVRCPARLHPKLATPLRRGLLAGAAGRLVRARHGLLCLGHAWGPAAAAFEQSGRPPRPVRRAICIKPCLLAAGLSAGWTDGSAVRNGHRLCGCNGAGHHRHGARTADLAGPRSRNHPTHA